MMWWKEEYRECESNWRIMMSWIGRSCDDELDGKEFCDEVIGWYEFVANEKAVYAREIALLEVQERCK